MVETEEKIEVESRCGIECSKCEFKEKMGCQGCINIKNPFWGECVLKKCAEDKNLKCCGECQQFPCELIKSFSYDENQGDNGLRIETCKKWCRKNN